MCYAQYGGFVKRAPDDLQADRQTVLGEAARYADRWQPCQVDRHGANIFQIHFDRIVDVFADLERGRRRSRMQNDIEVGENVVEVLDNQRAHLLRFL